MRFNDKELIKLAECTKADLEGVLHHMKPQSKDWSDWYTQQQFKERYFKLISNLLFYYRVGEQEPLGVLVLENAQVAYEHPHKGIPFAFSLTFKINDKMSGNTEAKHFFSCRCDSDVNKWVLKLKQHSYEYWRSQYIILQTKISMSTGQDPILDYMKQNNTNGFVQEIHRTKSVKTKQKKSTFCSHLEESSTFSQRTYQETVSATTSTSISSVDVDNLIEL